MKGEAKKVTVSIGVQSFKVEKGVPCPPIDRRGWKGYTAIVRKLKPGESVFLPTGTCAAQTIVRQTGGRFSANLLGDAADDIKKLRELGIWGLFAARREGNGTRIWRRR